MVTYKILCVFAGDSCCDSPVILKSEATFQPGIVVQEGHPQLKVYLIKMRWAIVGTTDLLSFFSIRAQLIPIYHPWNAFVSVFVCFYVYVHQKYHGESLVSPVPQKCEKPAETDCAEAMGGSHVQLAPVEKK